MLTVAQTLFAKTSWLTTTGIAAERNGLHESSFL